jgi:hypothetical protein
MTSAALVSASPISTDELRAAVGPRADYYLRKWERSDRGGFNWAAFLLSGVWLPYRKMYRATAILFAAIILETVLEELVFVGWLGMAETPRAVESSVSVAICWVCGGFGNKWYLSHVQRLVTASRTDDGAEEERLARLRALGGTSVLGALGSLLAFLIAMVAAIMVTDAALGLNG